MHHSLKRLSMTAATLLSFALSAQPANAEHVPVGSQLPARERDASAPGPGRRLFAALQCQFAARVDAHIRARVRRADLGVDREDIAQEVWRRAFVGLDRWDAAKVVFVAWVLRIAKHVISEHRRRVGRAARLAQDAAALATPAVGIGTQLDELIARESDARVRELLQELPPHEREVVILHGLQGHSLAEVGSRLAISTDAATKRWQRGCAHMRRDRRWRALREA